MKNLFTFNQTGTIKDGYFINKFNKNLTFRFKIANYDPKYNNKYIFTYSYYLPDLDAIHLTHLFTIKQPKNRKADLNKIFVSGKVETTRNNLGTKQYINGIELIQKNHMLKKDRALIYGHLIKHEHSNETMIFYKQGE